jgi:hypothetical protein
MHPNHQGDIDLSYIMADSVIQRPSLLTAVSDLDAMLVRRAIRNGGRITSERIAHQPEHFFMLGLGTDEDRSACISAYVQDMTARTLDRIDQVLPNI